MYDGPNPYDRAAEALWWFLKYAESLGAFDRVTCVHMTDCSHDRDDRRLLQEFLERKLLAIESDPYPLTELDLYAWEGELSERAQRNGLRHLRVLQDMGRRYNFDVAAVLKERLPDNPIQSLQIQDWHPSYYSIPWRTIPRIYHVYLTQFEEYTLLAQVGLVRQMAESLRGSTSEKHAFVGQ